MQQQWSKIVAPVLDHPLIFLGVQWAQVESHQYLLIAHSNIIDKGFHMERVRLIHHIGQVFEDAVDEGYVFFACQREEQVQLPMQAELYDRQSTLARQQEIPDVGWLPWLK